MNCNARVLLALVFLATGCSTGGKLGIELWSAPGRKISNDYILVSPSSASDEQAYGPQQVFLTDLRGRIAKRWTVKRTPNHSRLRSDGVLLSLLLSTGGRRLTANGGECNELIATGPDGIERFSIKIDGMTHDFDEVDVDKTAILKFERLDRSELRALHPKTQLEFAYLDRLTVIDNKGKESWGWSLKDHMRELNIGPIKESGVNFTNANSVQYIAKNPKTSTPAFLLSFRNLDLVLLVEYPSGKIIWQSPPGTLSRQHDATMQGSRLLVFNNNILGTEIPTLQLREWDLATGKESFFWQPPKWAPITTSVMGGVRLLSNGSYLVSNSIAGNLFEVDPITRNIVWSYVVLAERAGTRIWPLGMGFYRAETYPAETIKRMFGAQL